MNDEIKKKKKLKEQKQINGPKKKAQVGLA
jgi:hypothetical protein